jgi:signal transduction histidine kinase
LQVHFCEGPCPVRGEPERLTQIVGNLLDNASKYTPEHGEITLSTAVSGDGLQITITVSDNGIGITAQALPEVFEPFVQDILGMGFNGVGLGIGLTVVRELVEALGGDITAHSAGRGLGSRFVVTLPLAGGSTGTGTEPSAMDAAG